LEWQAAFELLLDGNRKQRPSETEFVAVGVNQMEGALMPFGIVGRGSWLVSRCERSAAASMRVRCQVPRYPRSQAKTSRECRGASGNDEAALALARDNALAVGAGHTFLIFLGDGFFPVNVLAAVRAVPEVCRIYCATANPTEVIVAQTELGRGVLGVVDGGSPLGVETDADIVWRKDLLRKIGCKL
jgi:adenosine/AMP kinase